MQIIYVLVRESVDRLNLKKDKNKFIRQKEEGGLLVSWE